jgi:hypothetical protein
VVRLVGLSRPARLVLWISHQSQGDDTVATLLEKGLVCVVRLVGLSCPPQAVFLDQPPRPARIVDQPPVLARVVDQQPGPTRVVDPE